MNYKVANLELKYDEIVYLRLGPNGCSRGVRKYVCTVADVSISFSLSLSFVLADIVIRECEIINA